ncbi:phospholipase D-like domain-containing protein [Denitratisoma sp. DHT3]|uniref:phospholipase D-like domain-containing protein n=1 Tax=Denitratisoma sp. DHT3 TaxID=1981880 RepID=UPI00164813EA|nr:phospholipase D-like domain-containing protein [Denitratisoma sp. DHT3]
MARVALAALAGVPAGDGGGPRGRSAAGARHRGGAVHALGRRRGRDPARARRARQAVHVQAYLLTSRTLARALVEAHQRGVRVEVLADAAMAEKGGNSQLPLLAAAGIPLRLERRYSAAHNKILLIDPEGEHPVVITGSYNYTWSAQARNAENLLLLRDHPALARAYLANWQRHRDEAEPYAQAEQGAGRSQAGAAAMGGRALRPSAREDARLLATLGECGSRGGR